MIVTVRDIKNFASALFNFKVFLRFLLLFSIFIFLYFFFFGAIEIPFLNLRFFRMTPISAFEYFYIFASSTLSSFIIILNSYSKKFKKRNKGVTASVISLGSLGAICPACLGINLFILGNVITFPLFSILPYIFWIQVASLIILSFLFLFNLKLSFNNFCAACLISKNQIIKKEFSIFGYVSSSTKKILISYLAISLVLIFYQIFAPFAFAFTGQFLAINKNNNLSFDINEITQKVVPKEGFTIEAEWKDVIAKMRKSGILDVEKLNKILSQRYNQPLTEEQLKLLNSEYSNEKLKINADNAVFMMYLLWVLGKHNNNTILHESPFAKYFENYDIGVGRPGYGDVNIIELTPEQQEIVREVALNSYRPCCNNPTGWPDCSHGFAALGLVELMASQGFSKEEIYDAFVKFNSFWFPSTYVQIAVYFKIKEGKDWNEVDKELVAGKEFSSLSGSIKVQNYLRSLGL